MDLKPRTVGSAIVGIVVLGGLLWFAFRTEPVAVDLVEVVQGPMEVTVNADGRTRIREVFDISAPIAGTARRSPVEVGDEVIAGETVVAVVEPIAPSLLDTRSRVQAEAAVHEAEAALRLAESQVRQAEEELAYAQSQYDRIKTLVERGVSSLTQLEDASKILSIRVATREAAQSSVAMARSSLERARAALIEPGAGTDPGGEACCVTLRAPITGRVLSVANVSEHTVTPGSPLVSIGQPDNLEIVADLLSADAVRLPANARAAVERWGGPEALRAELMRIEPSAVTKVSALGIEEQRVDAIFSLLSPPEERPGLGDQFAVFLRIVVWEADDVVQVPLSALFRHGGEWAVFVAEGDTARLADVEVGQRNARTAQILAGVEAGQSVITHPSDQITDGVPITLREEM
ncbi:efflux RND transporter periplasmic adaptor subunit [Ostreiculturibacter nitratireducens]|uniref:efflux RND transporter periplasmic adaptor subunit n=1 Tax=Ostreiculturibacter nitratireducens TaxID=3075226 RepID=UPI0031B5A96F